MSRLRLFAVLALVVLSGCALPGSQSGFDTDRDLGHVGDYAHDDTFAFDADDGLSETQLEAVKYRSMARIEVVRGLKYDRDVSLEIVSRAEYRDQQAGGTGNASTFRNELWRGAFVVDGETDVKRAFDDLYDDSVQGYYVNNRIVIVADDTDDVRINRQTLVHELTHALQDQHFGIRRESETIDGVRAENGLLEGEAGYVPQQYDRRCGDEWQCLPDYQPPTSSGEALTERPFNVGLFLSIYAPYAEGPPFVTDLYERGGWDAIDRAHDEPPRSTAQLIHPDRYPDTRPADVTISDRSSDDWRPITDGEGSGSDGGDDSDGTGNGEPRTETIGEATLFATLWANGVIDRPLTAGATDDSYNYSHPATEGWAGDSIQVYRNADEPTWTGHVWRLEWDRPADATEFADAYRRLLETRGAERVKSAGDGVYRIPDGEPFAGAYRVSGTGTTVEIVGAPAVDDLAAIHATEPESTPSPETAAALEPASTVDSAATAAP
ncbi:Hvo_1808 family surface protein [Natrinema sp. SYSU A 869]|uniref:Hvo_1808 family surface protein n=1 Tax=Natrinema sp. SYSU A 869 TaxID=2871694 RepID=UPI001CA4488F|nr:Hvo_1808 family surface protein [Natrinema sp. SYSU A 869]